MKSYVLKEMGYRRMMPMRHGRTSPCRVSVIGIEMVMMDWIRGRSDERKSDRVKPG